ncbi:MAG: PEGA domain-containing protein [Firmicutes bacterium]|nr:PEGA domain-containing protein [Bacillota bacterium]
MAYDDPPEQNNGNKLAGFMLVFMMLIIIGVMIYVVVASKNSGMETTVSSTTGLYSGMQTPIASPADYIIHEAGEESPIAMATGATPTPGGTATATPEEEPSTPSSSPTSQYPGVRSTPVAVASPDIFGDIDPAKPSPKPSPQPSKKAGEPKPGKSPTPKASPAKEEPPEPAFEPPKPDGPPSMDRMAGNLFEGKQGKAKITIFSKALPARTYLIDTSKNVYWDLKLKPLGKSRFLAEFPPGNYRLKIVKSNYFSFDEAFQVADGDEAEITDDPMKKRPSLEISSNPPGARILINGGFAGSTPKVINGLDVVEYTIKLKKKGFKDKEFKVKLKTGKTEKKSIQLSK